MAKERSKPEPGKKIEKGKQPDKPDIKEIGSKVEIRGLDRLPEPDPTDGTPKGKQPDKPDIKEIGSKVEIRGLDRLPERDPDTTDDTSNGGDDAD